MQENLTALKSLGANLVALSPQLPAHSLGLIDKQRLGFDILRDAGNDYTAQLGLRFALPGELVPIYQGFGIDLPACNGEPSWTLPMPARLVVDRQGIVRATDIDPDYTQRPEPAATLAALQALRV